MWKVYQYLNSLICIVYVMVISNVCVILTYLKVADDAQL